MLILLALLGAFFIPQASIPRLALSTVGLMSGLLLVVLAYYRLAWRLARRLFEELVADLFRFCQLAGLFLWRVGWRRDDDAGCLGWQAGSALDERSSLF